MNVKAEDLSLLLAKSGVGYADGVIYRIDEEQNVMGKYPLNKVRDISVKKRFDYSCIVGLIIFAVLVYCPYKYLDNEVLRWILYGVGGLIGLLAMAGCMQMVLVVQFKGKAVEFDLKEDDDVAKGFVESVVLDMEK